MKCPACDDGTEVRTVKQVEGGKRTKRRRVCVGCDFQFVTYESPQLIEPADYFDVLERRLAALGFTRQKIAEILAP